MGKDYLFSRDRRSISLRSAIVLLHDDRLSRVVVVASGTDVVSGLQAILRLPCIPWFVLG
jgi:hypothetical protein